MPVQTIRSLLGVPPSVPSVHDSVLVIVDAQGEYASGLLRVARIRETRAVIKALLDRYRAAHGKVVHVVADALPGSPIFTPGTPLAAILEELTPVGDEPVVHKVHASAFTSPAFQDALDKAGRKKLVVVGYMAHNCVSSTVRQAAERGYSVYAVRDAVGDRDIPNATAEELVRPEVSLAEVADTVATIIESNDVL